MSKTGDKIFFNLSDLAIKTPIGVPIIQQIKVATDIIAIVDIVSFHIPK